MTEAVFVIVGAGQAGAMAAAELRQQGFTGQLILIGAEPHLPYERPPPRAREVAPAGTADTTCA